MGSYAYSTEMMKCSLIAMVLLVAGCAQQQQQPGTETTETDAVKTDEAGTSARGNVPVANVHRGMLKLAAPLRFRPCGAQTELPATDVGGKVASVPRDLADTAGVVFSIVRGTRTDTMRITEVLYAMSEGYECYTDWSSFEARALGNEPGWVVEVNRGALKLQRQGGFTAEWANATSDTAGSVVRYSAQHAQHGTIVLTLEPRPCRDAMSGAYYIWTAQLRLGNEILNGCGIRV